MIGFFIDFFFIKMLLSNLISVHAEIFWVFPDLKQLDLGIWRDFLLGIVGKLMRFLFEFIIHYWIAFINAYLKY